MMIANRNTYITNYIWTREKKMYCSNCGNKILNNVKFCSCCGAEITTNETVENCNNTKTILLKCKNCNGELIVDENQQIVLCPYCGSKELMVESDSVKTAKIVSNAYRDVEIGKQQTSIEMQRIAIEEKHRAEKEYVHSKIMGLLLLLGSIALFILCVEIQTILNGGARLFITIACFVLFILGCCLLKRKR